MELMKHSSRDRRVIVVLANGITREGEVTELGRLRLDVGLEYYRDGYAGTIIVSGRGSHYDPTGEGVSLLTEAKTMKDYLVAQGVPTGTVLEEDASVDTIGNLFFTRARFLDPHGWFEPLIISSDFHMDRVKAIAEWVLGDSYAPRFAGAAHGAMSAAQLTRTQEIEEVLLEHFRDVIRTIAAPGDLRTIGRELFRQ